MTDSLNSPQKPLHKVLLVAGLNNNDVAMRRLADELETRGFSCELVNLPGQGDDRSETETLERAQAVFSRKMMPLTKDPYSVIAFSTGALYYNLWLMHNRHLGPLNQVLLSPAFTMRNESFMKAVFNLLPGAFTIKSLAPGDFRRYGWMKIAEYRILLELILKFRKSRLHFQTPVKIFIDQRDELVSAKDLKIMYPEVTTVFKRKLGKIRPGMYHAIFHSDFWDESSWNAFVDEVSGFLSSQIVSQERGA